MSDSILSHQQMVAWVKRAFPEIEPLIMNGRSLGADVNRRVMIDLRFRSYNGEYDKIITPLWRADRPDWITVQTLNVGAWWPILGWARWGDDRWKPFMSNSGRDTWFREEHGMFTLPQLWEYIEKTAD